MEKIDQLASGNFKINPHAGLMLNQILFLSVRNKVFLSHIVEEMYLTKREKQRALKKLKAETEKQFYDLLAEILKHSDSPNQSKT